MMIMNESFAVEGTCFVSDDQYDYEIINDKEVYFKLTRKNIYGVFFPFGNQEVIFKNSLIATETLRDAVSFHHAKKILEHAKIPADHIFWKLGEKG